MGRFFCAQALLFLALAAPAAAAQQWDLILVVDAKGAVSVSSQQVREDGDPPSPPQAPREGLSYLEVHDEDGRVLDRRAVPLAPEVFHDTEGAPGQLQGGAVPVPRMAYQVRLPRRPGRRQSLHVFRVHRRPGAAAPAAPSRALSGPPPSDLDFESQAVIPLGDVP